MAIVYNRLSGLELQPGEKTVLKRNGISEKTSVYISLGDPGTPFVPLYTPYPAQQTNGFVCDTVTKEQLTFGFFKVTVIFVSLTVGATSYVTYDTKVIQVPISQSPQFTTIAGTPSSPLNGAVFDASGQFIGFGPGQYQGVVSAFIPQQLQIIRGSGPFPYFNDPNLFPESVVQTLRGNVWEFEVTYNLSINIQTGLPIIAPT